MCFHETSRHTVLVIHAIYTHTHIYIYKLYIYIIYNIYTCVYYSF